VDLILCLREPGADEIIVDEAKYEDGQKVENQVTKKTDLGKSLAAHAGSAVVILKYY
jgi:hypothetical protein